MKMDKPESNGHSPADCEAVMKKVQLALDGELTTDEEKIFLGEVENCNCCLEKYNIERSFKDFLIKKIEKKCVSPELKRKITSRLKESAASNGKM